MTTQDIEELLINKCKSLDLKNIALNILTDSYLENPDILLEYFGCDFDKTSIIPVFDGFKYQIEKRHYHSAIRTRIGLYKKDETNVWLDDLVPIGYFELETDFEGDVLDSWFEIENNDNAQGLDIIPYVKSLNKKLPIEYLSDNHAHYSLVTYISLIGNLFISNEFQSAWFFIQKSYQYLSTTNNATIDNAYLKECRKFLKTIKLYLLAQNLVTDNPIIDLNDTNLSEGFL